MTEVAEAFGVAPSQLCAWRKQIAGGELDAEGDGDLRAHRRERSARCRTPRRRLPRTRPAG
ncbi:hypothetical protein SLT36_25370 [Aminobacter sp. BA135]|uniref:hypothetical protein n=1 Tax=Aminobacter sp. BA135 TaxID=537596 RepID=UPI003D7A38D2